MFSSTHTPIVCHKRSFCCNLVPPHLHSGNTPISHSLQRPTRGLPGAPSAVRTKCCLHRDVPTHIRYLSSSGCRCAFHSIHRPDRGGSLATALGVTYLAAMSCASLSHLRFHSVTSVRALHINISKVHHALPILVVQHGLLHHSMLRHLVPRSLSIMHGASVAASSRPQLHSCDAPFITLLKDPLETSRGHPQLFAPSTVSATMISRAFAVFPPLGATTQAIHNPT